MTVEGTLNDFLCSKVRAIVLETFELHHGRQTVEVHHFKRRDSLWHAQITDKHGARLANCQVDVDASGSAVAFNGQVDFFSGPTGMTLDALKIERYIKFSFASVDYSHAGIEFRGVHLIHSPLKIAITIDPTTLDQCYQSNGLVDSINMELFRHTDL